MTAVELVVPIAGEHECGDRLHAASEEPQDIEGRLVRAMHILEDEDRWRPRPQLTYERRRNLIRPRAGLHELLQLSAGALGDVGEGPEWTWSEQCIASPPQKSRAAGPVVAEASQERGLADTGLSADEQDPPARAALDGFQVFAEHRELAGALE